MRPSFRQSLKRLVVVGAIGLTAVVPTANDLTAPAFAADPVITITTPANGAVFDLGEAVVADYECTDADPGDVPTCDGPVPDGTPIDTTTEAVIEFTVESTDGTTPVTLTSSYTVLGSDPTASISSPPDGSAYQPGANVTAAYSCADAESGVASCVGDVPNGAPIDTVGEGAKSFSVVATDNVGNTSTAEHDYTIDGTDPIVTITSPPNGATFDTGEAIIAAYSCTDPGSGIASCVGDVSIGQQIDTATEGPQSFTVTGTDSAGNTTQVIHTYDVVTPDTTGPTVTITSPPDASAYPVGTAVIAAYTCVDNDSGVDTCVGSTAPGVPIDTASEGFKTFTVTGTDNAGNPTTVDHDYTVDSTAPVVTVAEPDDADAYMLGATILADYSCSDSLSGIASCVGDVADGAALDTATPGPKTFSVTATDEAGNTTTLVRTYSVDADPPAVAIFEPGDGDTYVFGSDVTVNFACVDTGSGIDACTGTLPDGATLDTTAEGDYSFTVTAIDNAGNTTILTHQYSVASADSIPQTVALISPADGAVYENGAVVFVDFTCIKYTSCVGSVPEGTVLNTTVPGTFSVTVTATDDAGKIEAVTNTYTVEPPDLLAPVVTLTSPPDGAEYDFQAVVTAQYSCTDDSGSTTCEAPYPVGGLIDTTTPGVYSFTVKAVDPAGNTTVVSHTYTVGEPDTFIDDDNSVFEQDIEWLAASGITRGCNPPLNNRFCPKSLVTRAQIAAFLSRALNLTEQLDDPYVDDDDSIFEDDIERIAAAGITKGCLSPALRKFCPDGKFTREQMAAFLSRALGLTDNGGGNLFTDDDSSIFEDEIDLLGAAGITLGCNPPANTKFCPKDLVTRGQLAAFLRRAFG